MACSTAWGSPSKPAEGTRHQNVSDCPQNLGQRCQERAELSARHRTRGRHMRLQTQEGNGTGPDQEVLLPHHTLRSACPVSGCRTHTSTRRTSHSIKMPRLQGPSGGRAASSTQASAVGALGLMTQRAGALPGRLSLSCVPFLLPPKAGARAMGATRPEFVVVLL